MGAKCASARAPARVRRRHVVLIHIIEHLHEVELAHLLRWKRCWLPRFSQSIAEVAQSVNLHCMRGFDCAELAECGVVLRGLFTELLTVKIFVVCYLALPVDSKH